MLPGFCCRVLVLLGSVLLVTPLEPLFPGPCGLDGICQGAKTVRRDQESSTGTQGSRAWRVTLFLARWQSHWALSSVSDAGVSRAISWFLTGTHRGETHSSQL